MKTLRKLTVSCLLALLACSLHAQTTTTTTTLSAAITGRADTVVRLTSGTDVAAGGFIFVDREQMAVLGAVGSSTTIWNVRRGVAGISSTHASGQKVYVARPGPMAGAVFRQQAPVGSCTATAEPYLPLVIVPTGEEVNCAGSKWVTSAAAGTTVCTDATGSSAHFTCPNPSRPVQSYAGLIVAFKPQTTNGATPDLDVGGLGAKNLKQADCSTAVSASALTGGSMYTFVYDGTSLCQASSSGSSSIVNASFGSGASSLSRTATAGVGGVTTKLLAAKDTTDPTRRVLPASGGCGGGFAATTATVGNTFELYVSPGTVVTAVADNTITAGHILVGGTSTVGRVRDSGQTSRTAIESNKCIVGVALEGKTVGQDVLIEYDGPGTYGQAPANLGAITYNAAGTTTFAAANAVVAFGSVTTTNATSTTFSPTGLIAGGTYRVKIIQDATGGGVTFTLGTAGTCSAWEITGGGSGAVTLSTGANAKDWLEWTYDGTYCSGTFFPNRN